MRTSCHLDNGSVGFSCFLWSWIGLGRRKSSLQKQLATKALVHKPPEAFRTATKEEIVIFSPTGMKPRYHLISNTSHTSHTIYYFSLTMFILINGLESKASSLLLLPEVDFPKARVWEKVGHFGEISGVLVFGVFLVGNLNLDSFDMFWQCSRNCGNLNLQNIILLCDMWHGENAMQYLFCLQESHSLLFSHSFLAQSWVVLVSDACVPKPVSGTACFVWNSNSYAPECSHQYVLGFGGQQCKVECQHSIEIRCARVFGAAFKGTFTGYNIIVSSSYLELWSPRFDSEAPVELEDVGDWK